MIYHPHQTVRENLSELSALVNPDLRSATRDYWGRFRPRVPWAVNALNKSAVVLTTAMWEAFVEDTATAAFEFVINSASNPNDVPRKVVKFVCAKLKSDKNEIASWRLAGDGWRSELKKYRDGVITRYAGSLNSPRSGQVDDLFLYLTGLKRVSDSWTWQGMNAASAKKKLDSYISHRGEIVHRFKTTKDVTRGYVVEYIQFVLRLTVKTANRVRNHTHKITGQHPWKAARFRSVR